MCRPRQPPPEKAVSFNPGGLNFLVPHGTAPRKGRFSRTVGGTKKMSKKTAPRGGSFYILVGQREASATTGSPPKSKNFPIRGGNNENAPPEPPPVIQEISHPWGQQRKCPPQPPPAKANSPMRSQGLRRFDANLVSEKSAHQSDFSFFIQKIRFPPLQKRRDILLPGLFNLLCRGSFLNHQS